MTLSQKVVATAVYTTIEVNAIEVTCRGIPLQLPIGTVAVVSVNITVV